jgi:hypothetical protein
MAVAARGQQRRGGTPGSLRKPETNLLFRFPFSEGVITYLYSVDSTNRDSNLSIIVNYL